MLRRVFLSLAAALLLSVPAAAQDELDPENTLVMQLSTGEVVIELYPQFAPKHVAQIKTLVRQDFYDGVVWHRVIDGFMAQSGDPTGTGRGSSDLPDIPAEFSGVPFERGVMGMARSASYDSANSQFFIMFDRNPSLDGLYTVVGRVIEGMENVDQIKKAAPDAANGMVDNPDQIISLDVMVDVR